MWTVMIDGTFNSSYSHIEGNKGDQEYVCNYMYVGTYVRIYIYICTYVYMNTCMHVYEWNQNFIFGFEFRKVKNDQTISTITPSLPS